MKNLKITVNGVTYDVQVEESGGGASAPVTIAAPVAAAKPETPATVSAPAKTEASTPSGQIPSNSTTVKCPMPGTILAVNVKVGDKVKKGNVLLILEAMKMENEIMSPVDATVVAVHVAKGESVDTGSPLISLQ